MNMQLAEKIAATLWFAGVSSARVGKLSTEALLELLADSGLSVPEIAEGLRTIGNMQLTHAEALREYVDARFASGYRGDC